MNEDTQNMVDDLAQLPSVADMQLELTKDEKIRATAMVLAIRYHTETIIKDPRYLELMIQREKEAKFANDPETREWHLRPSTVEGVIHICQQFELFLCGHNSLISKDVLDKAGVEIVEPGHAQGDMA